MPAPVPTPSAAPAQNRAARRAQKKARATDAATHHSGGPAPHADPRAQGKLVRPIRRTG